MTNKVLKWGMVIVLACLAIVACFTAVTPALAHPALTMPDFAHQHGALSLVGFGGMIINRQNLSAMFTGFNTVFQQAFDGAPTDWNKIAMRVPSTTSQEQYGWLKNISAFREWIGDRVIQNLASSDYTLKNKPWENTVGVDRDDIDDDKLGIYTPIIQQLGLSAKQHPDELIFELLKQGFSKTCYDGQYFFDTDHPVLSGETVTSVSNFGGGAGEPWFLMDDTRAIKPLIYQVRKDYKFVAMDKDDDESVFTRKQFRYGVDARSNVGFGLWQLAYGSKQALDATAYAAARTAMMNIKGDNGKPLGIRPTLLVTTPANEQAALNVLQAERLANGATNVYRNTAKLLVTSWLA
jgi:phage major head subunit gpT-like protein